MTEPITCPACGAKLKLRLECDDLQRSPAEAHAAPGDTRNEAALAELNNTARILAQSQAAKAPLIQATATLNVTPTRWDVK